MRIFRYMPRFCLVFLVAIAISRSLSSNLGARTTPDSASAGFVVSFLKVSMGCLTDSRSENREVSLTKEGLPLN